MGMDLQEVGDGRRLYKPQIIIAACPIFYKTEH
jgi:hypothetical protein